MGTENLGSFKYYSYMNLKDNNTMVNRPFMQYRHKISPEINEDSYTRDFHGRYYRCKKMKNFTVMGEYLAYVSLVIPVYLLLLNTKINLETYHCFNNSIVANFF